MPTDLELLTASFDADITKFQKKMDALGVSYNKQVAGITKGQETIAQKFANWSLDFTGINKATGALAALTGVAIVGGIGDLVKKSLEAAASIGDIAIQAGVSTDLLQKLRYAASQSGASFSVLDEGITNLNKNFGEFINTGAGRAAAAFKSLGIDTLVNSGQLHADETGKLFDILVDKISKYGSAAQQASLLSKLFGNEAGPQLRQLIDQGTAGVAALEARAVALHLVLSGDTIKSARDANKTLNSLFETIQAEGVAAVANFAPEISDLAKRLADALPTLIDWVQKFAEWTGLIRQSSLEKINDQIADVQKNLATGPDFFDSFFVDKDNVIDGWKKQLADLEKQRSQLLAASPVETVTVTATRPANHIAQTPQEIALAQRQKQAQAQSVLDAKTAAAALLAAQDQTNVQLLQGSAGYYAAVQKQIDDEYTSKVDVAQAETAKQLTELEKQGTGWKGYAAAVANINAELTDKVATYATERARAIDAAGPTGFIREALIAGQQQITQYSDQIAVLGLTAGAVAKLTYVQQQLNDAKQKGITLGQKDIDVINAEGDAIGAAAQKADQAARANQDNVQFADELRTGLEDVGAAGLKGFGSLKSAAASFLEQIAEMILKLYVLKPLIEGIHFLGPSGTTLPGFDGLGSVNVTPQVFGGLGSVDVTPQVFGSGGGSDFLSSIGDFIANLFDDGGYTGPGGKFQPAGIVHKGEVVWSQADIARAGGVGVVEALRRGVGGYADGGPVAANFTPVSVPRLAERASAPAVLNFDLRGAVVTQDLLDQMNRIANNVSNTNARAAVAQYDRQALPGRVATLVSDPRRRY